MEWRVSQKYLSRFDGYYTETGGLHFGVDLICVAQNGCNITDGMPLYAIEDGIVKVASKNKLSSTGLQIVTKHNYVGSEVYYRSYQHLSKVAVKKGYIVKKGDLIGFCGGTGNITGPHLHTDKYFRHNEPALSHLYANYDGVHVYYVDPELDIDDLAGRGKNVNYSY